MNAGNVARLTEGMSLADIQREIHKLGDFRTPPSQHHTMENGVEVIYVKKTDLQDRLKRMLMSDDMKADEAMPLANLIFNICKEKGIDISPAELKNIRESLVNDNRKFREQFDDLVTMEVMNQHSRNHGF